MGISNAADFACGMQIPAIRAYPADTSAEPLGSAPGACKSVLVGCTRALSSPQNPAGRIQGTDDQGSECLLVRKPDSSGSPPASEALGDAGGTGWGVGERSMSVMEMFQQHGSQTEPNSNLFTWSSRRCMLIPRGMI